MPNSKKKDWVKPAIAKFQSADDALSLVRAKGKPEEAARFSKALERSREQRESHSAEDEIYQRRRA